MGFFLVKQIVLDVISQDNSRNYVFHFEIKAKVALQEEREGARGRDLRSGTPFPGSPPTFPGLSPAHRPSLSSPQAPSSPAAYTSHQQAFLLGW